MIGSADSDAPLSQRDCAILRRLKANRRSFWNCNSESGAVNEAGIAVLSTTYDDCPKLTITVISRFLTLHVDRQTFIQYFHVTNGKTVHMTDNITYTWPMKQCHHYHLWPRSSYFACSLFCCWQPHAIHVVISRKRWHVINDPNGCSVKTLQLLAVFLLHATDGDKIMTWQTAFCRNTAW